jgi:hypothetical protein
MTFGYLAAEHIAAKADSSEGSTDSALQQSA